MSPTTWPLGSSWNRSPKMAFIWLWSAAPLVLVAGSSPAGQSPEYPAASSTVSDPPAVGGPEADPPEPPVVVELLDPPHAASATAAHTAASRQARRRRPGRRRWRGLCAARATAGDRSGGSVKARVVGAKALLLCPPRSGDPLRSGRRIFTRVRGGGWPVGAALIDRQRRIAVEPLAPSATPVQRGLRSARRTEWPR